MLRGHSLKTRMRNRLSVDTLDSLLRIAVEGSSPQDYPIQEAVELWAKKKTDGYNYKYIHKTPV